MKNSTVVANSMIPVFIEGKNNLGCGAGALNRKNTVNNCFMEEDKEKGVNRDSNVNWNDNDSDLNQYETLHDKWNDIQEAYLRKYPQLKKENLFFESGGFEGLIEKISEIRGKSVEEIRSEIENW